MGLGLKHYEPDGIKADAGSKLNLSIFCKGLTQMFTPKAFVQKPLGDWIWVANETAPRWTREGYTTITVAFLI